MVVPLPSKRFSERVDLVTAAGTVGIGIGVGFLGGAFGKGGSAIATPLLAAVGVPAFAAVASPLPATIPATAVAAREYHRLGLVDRRVLAWGLGAGIPATVVGALLSRVVGGGPLVVLTELVLLGLGLRLLAGHGSPDEVAGDEPTSVAAIVAVVGLTGLLSGLLANSGGFLLAPLFITALRLPLKSALGTSLAASAVLAVPGTITHAALGHIDWAVTALFLVSAVPLSRYGARVALRTRADRLERAYGAFLVAISAALLLVRVL